jgi:hypothetical protein
MEPALASVAAPAPPALSKPDGTAGSGSRGKALAEFFNFHLDAPHPALR